MNDVDDDAHFFNDVELYGQLEGLLSQIKVKLEIRLFWASIGWMADGVEDQPPITNNNNASEWPGK